MNRVVENGYIDFYQYVKRMLSQISRLTTLKGSIPFQIFVSLV